MAGEDVDLRPPSILDGLRRRLGPPRPYRLTRSLLLRLLALVYLFAFIGLVKQGLPLLGSHGLTPITATLDHLRAAGRDVVDVPTLFWLDASDGTITALAWIGVALSLVTLAGYANAPVMAALWILYGSFVRVGSAWFGFGWEIQLLETGFLAIFLAPPLDPRPLASRPPPIAVIVLHRWLIVRIMLGAGLIKLRGDSCWTDLTCLDHHFETQPIPNPLSPWFHHLPHAVHAIGVLLNHVVELIAPLFAFGPRRLRLAAALAMASFQLTLIVSGNLAFLNWLTLVPIIACLDDDFLLRVMPRRARRWLALRTARADAAGRAEPHRASRLAAGVLAAIVAVLSLNVVSNLASPRQAMNRSYDRLALVNTYGAFGSVTATRRELVIEGTRADDPAATDAAWLAYELPCKPGEPDRRPCVLGPYHLRFDWLIWFAAMYDEPGQAPWLIHAVWKLLHADRGVRRLLAVDPFGDRPPRWIRIRRFVYRFAPPGAAAWWTRDDEELWLPPVSADTPGLLEYLARYGWPSPIDEPATTATAATSTTTTPAATAARPAPAPTGE
jgi:hypothetical protein